MRPWRQSRHAGSRSGGNSRASPAGLAPQSGHAGPPRGNRPVARHVALRSASPPAAFHVEHSRWISLALRSAPPRPVPRRQPPAASSGEATRRPQTGTQALSLAADRPSVVRCPHGSRPRLRPPRLRRRRTPWTELCAALGYPNNYPHNPARPRDLDSNPAAGLRAVGPYGGGRPDRDEEPRSRSTWNKPASVPGVCGRPQRHSAQVHGPGGSGERIPEPTPESGRLADGSVIGCHPDVRDRDPMAGVRVLAGARGLAHATSLQAEARWARLAWPRGRRGST